MPSMPRTQLPSRQHAETWCKLDPVWEGSVEEAAALKRENLPSGVARMSLAHKLAVLSTGSPTQHMEIMANGQTIKAERLQQEMLPPASLRPAGHVPPPDRVPAAISARPVQRQTLKKVGEDGTPWMYGASWWSQAAIDKNLENPSAPIGTNLKDQKMEVFREMHSIVCGNSERLEELFHCPGPFWARYYTLHHGGEPMCVIYDVFSPRMFQDDA